MDTELWISIHGLDRLPDGVSGDCERENKGTKRRAHEKGAKKTGNWIFLFSLRWLIIENRGAGWLACIAGGLASYMGVTRLSLILDRFFHRFSSYYIYVFSFCGDFSCSIVFLCFLLHLPCFHSLLFRLDLQDFSSDRSLSGLVFPLLPPLLVCLIGYLLVDWKH